MGSLTSSGKELPTYHQKVRNCEDALSNNKYIGWIYQSWIGSLPSELRLSKSLRNVRLPMGLMIQLASLSMFLYFFISGIETSKNASFLSLDKTAGDCNDVKISISDTYFVDYQGHWSTSPDYDDSKATFKVQFVGVEMNNDEYKDFTKNVLYPYLKNLNMGNKNWAENFLIWSKSETFEFEYGGGKVFVSIMGNTFTYENDYYLQDCDLSSGSCSQYATSTSSMYTMLSTQSYSSIMKSYFMNKKIPFTEPDDSDKMCITQPDNSGINGAFAGYGTNIYMVDNSGGSNDYTMTAYTESSSNPPWYFSYLISSDGTGTGTISTTDYCSSSFTPSYAYFYIPIIGTGLFNAAQGQNSGTYYNTLSANSADCNVCSENMNPDCNDPSKLSLYIGLLEISYPNNVQCQSYDANSGVYSDCAIDHFYTQKMLNERNMLGEKLFPLIDIMNTNYDITTLKNDPTLQEYIDFDAVTKIRLTQFNAENMGVYESLNLHNGLSANDIQLSCSDSLGSLGPFNPDSDASNNPPTQLTEKYYVCTPSVSTAFLDSFGIASSNTATFMGIFITLMITGYIQYVKYTSKREISAISSDDISSIIEMLGTALVNRNIHREKKQTLPFGTITSISNELIEEEKAIEDGADVELASVKNPYLPEHK